MEVWRPALTATLAQVTLQSTPAEAFGAYPLVSISYPMALSLTLQPGFKHCESGLSSAALYR